MNRMFTRITKVGRITIFSVGLAVVLALAAGGATTALAALPGDPFRLGQVNTLNAVATILTGENTTGAMLEIGNSSGDLDDPALRLRVRAGAPPLDVNVDAGKAINLDADKLDGRDSATFAAGTNGKANDAELLDGKDSAAFATGVNGRATDADLLDGRDSTTFANGTNGKATDADLLDGKDSTAFASAINGKATDADKLDGKDSTAFANGTNGKANDANLLDGKDSTAFANGTNGKANDADRLDGKDSTAFWTGKSYIESRTQSGGGAGSLIQLSASCDTGDTLLSVTGGTIQGEEDVLLQLTALSSTTGLVFLKDNGAPGTAQVQVICADFPPLRP